MQFIRQNAVFVEFCCGNFWLSCFGSARLFGGQFYISKIMRWVATWYLLWMPRWGFPYWASVVFGDSALLLFIWSGVQSRDQVAKLFEFLAVFGVEADAGFWLSFSGVRTWSGCFFVWFRYAIHWSRSSLLRFRWLMLGKLGRAVWLSFKAVFDFIFGRWIESCLYRLG